MKQPFLIDFDTKGEPEKGILSVIESGSTIPFEVKRMFWLYEVPDLEERGNHAHFTNEQVLIPMHGAVRILLENTKRKKFEFELHRPDQGLFIPALYWHKMQFFDHAALLVLASNLYNEADYINDYTVFRTLKDETNG
ncbi:MAG: FdtA/QdtA family cupin domain-containing protein [Bacteroidota bacterium]